MLWRKREQGKAGKKPSHFAYGKAWDNKPKNKKQKTNKKKHTNKQGNSNNDNNNKNKENKTKKNELLRHRL